MKRILLIAFIAISINGSAQWVQQTSGTVNDLIYMAAPSSNVAYINNYGSILKTTNGGSNWNTIPGASINVNAPICFTSVDTGYITGTGGILKTEDGGATWIDNFTYNIGNANASFFSFLNANVGFAVCFNLAGDSLLTFKTTNAGGSWSYCGNFLSNVMPTSIFFTNVTTGFMVVGANPYAGIYKTINGGTTWLPNLITPDAVYLNTVFFPSSSIGYAVGYDSTFKTTDGGNTWNQMNNINSAGNISVYFTDDNHGYAVGGDGISIGAIIKTIDGGVNWTLDLSTTQTFYSVSLPNANTGYACGTGGMIYKLATSVGVNELSQNNEINIYPNPFSPQAIISFSETQQKTTIKIMDVVGKEIKSVLFSGNSLILEKEEMQSGVYFVQITDEKKNVVNKKIIVQ